MTLLIADVSEYQSVDFTVFSGPIIVRAHNGRRADYHWERHAAGASAQSWWAAYQYLPANVGAGWAAQQFLATLGTFRPNCTILDLEEGQGDQQQRQHDWLDIMANDPARDWTYSGDYFARTHGLTVDWIAAYQKREPTAAHTLWQFTDAHDFPGIGPCDGSVFDGSIDDLVALTSSGPTPQPPSSEDDMPGKQFKLPDDTIVVCPANGGKPWVVPGEAGPVGLQALIDEKVVEANSWPVTDQTQADHILALTK